MLESMRSCGVFNTKNRASEKTTRVRKETRSRNTKKEQEGSRKKKLEEEMKEKRERKEHGDEEGGLVEQAQGSTCLVEELELDKDTE